MIKLNSKRVAGFGKGKEINFPTINFFLEKLPSGLSEGLWAVRYNRYNSMSLISKYLNGFRIETHVLNNTLNINVGDTVSLFLIKKLREPKIVKDITELIKGDKTLITDFFRTYNGCYDCQLCYVQDTGYSNYTVEDSYMGCYLVDNNFKHDYIEMDNEDDTKYNAVNCNSLLKGEYWSLDVDGESEGPTDEWLNSTMKIHIRDNKLKQLLNE